MIKVSPDEKVNKQVVWAQAFLFCLQAEHDGGKHGSGLRTNLGPQSSGPPVASAVGR